MLELVSIPSNFDSSHSEIQTSSSEVVGVVTEIPAGQSTQFEIHSLNEVGQILPLGGDDYSATLTGPSQITVNVQDNCDGTYLATYTATVAGQYTLEVALDGEVFYNAEVVVLPGSADPTKTIISGNAECGDVSTVAVFRIITVDQYGNARNTGGDSVAVSVTSISGNDLSEHVSLLNVEDGGDGTYTVSYQTEFTGAFVLSVWLNDVTIVSIQTTCYGGKARADSFLIQQTTNARMAATALASAQTIIRAFVRMGEFHQIADVRILLCSFDTDSFCSHLDTCAIHQCYSDLYSSYFR